MSLRRSSPRGVISLRTFDFLWRVSRNHQKSFSFFLGEKLLSWARGVLRKVKRQTKEERLKSTKIAPKSRVSRACRRRQGRSSGKACPWRRVGIEHAACARLLSRALPFGRTKRVFSSRCWERYFFYNNRLFATITGYCGKMAL